MSNKLYNDTGSFDEVEEGELMNSTDYNARINTLDGAIAMGEMAIRLASNPDYKALVMDVYLTREPARLAGMLASARINGDPLRHVTEDLIGIGKFSNFMSMVIAMGQQASVDKSELTGLRDQYGLAEDHQ